MCRRTHACAHAHTCAHTHTCEVYPPAKSAKLQTERRNLCVCVGYMFANAANTFLGFAKSLRAHPYA
jgi:hypothetical protein